MSCRYALESKITTKEEEIRTLKARLSNIVRQHEFATVQDFYTTFYTAQRAFDAYQKERSKWEEAYGEKVTPKFETIHDKIKRYQEKSDNQNANRPYQSKDKGGEIIAPQFQGIQSFLGSLLFRVFRSGSSVGSFSRVWF